MSELFQPVRGMYDIGPLETRTFLYLETVLAKLMARYGYEQIRTPVVEKTDLFKRTIGEKTDIIEKEMYTFADRNNESLTLRPEGTASVVRACLDQGWLHHQTPRLWYLGPMFRYERPQKGRNRQFYQFGVEAFGLPGPDIEAEIILMMVRLWQELGLSERIRLEINSLGSLVCRQEYRKKLVAYFTDHESALDEDSRRRLTTNPLRILDSKNPELRALIEGAPKLMDTLDAESAAHFEEFCHLLDGMGIGYQINPCLVRGLDYYSRTVFEWITDDLGSQSAVCAGGRYDGLVEQVGGRPTSGVGFAMGLERVILMIEQFARDRLPQATIDCYLITEGENVKQYALMLSERLRTELPALTLLMHCGEGSMKSQFKRADKIGARFALIMGEDEMLAGTVGVKSLRTRTEQQTVPLSDIVDFLSKEI